jgi:signal transduction histidine kinase
MRDFRELVMGAPLLIMVERGPDLRLELLNPHARQAFGGRDLTGKVLREAFPELEQWLRKRASVVRTGEIYVGVAEAMKLDWAGTGTTETRYMTLVCQPLHRADGAIDGTVTFAIDVTSTVLERAKNPREWLERALDAIATPVLLAEPNTRHIVFSNAAARELSDGVFGQAIGLDPGCFVTDANGAHFPVDQLPVSRASRGEAVEAMDLLWHTPSGVVPLVCFAEKVDAANTLPALVVLSFFDVSGARCLERELRDEASRRDDFLGLVAHELRTPLTAMKLQAHSLAKQYPSAAGVVAVERAAERMERLVEQMLDVARISVEGVRLELEDFDLCRVIDGVIEGFRSEAQRAGSRVTHEGAPALRGRWDRARLRHVVANLLCNALRFGAGSPITIECRDLGDRVTVAVSDRGIGIDPADQERIFERYQRAASPRNFGGLGLGLWITREIVNRMGGSIAVRSAPGRGATFTVELPKSSGRPAGERR